MIDTIACWTGILAALLLALNIKYSPFAYILFFISSFLWVEYGLMIKNKSIVVMNFVFSIINLIGIVRWILIS